MTFEERADTWWRCAGAATPSSMVLSQDAACYIDWIDPEVMPFLPNGTTCTSSGRCCRRASAGVSDEQIATMLVANPRRLFEDVGSYSAATTGVHAGTSPADEGAWQGVAAGRREPVTRRGACWPVRHRAPRGSAPAIRRSTSTYGPGEPRWTCGRGGSTAPVRLLPSPRTSTDGLGQPGTAIHPSRCACGARSAGGGSGCPVAEAGATSAQMTASNASSSPRHRSSCGPRSSPASRPSACPPGGRAPRCAVVPCKGPSTRFQCRSATAG